MLNIFFIEYVTADDCPGFNTEYRSCKQTTNCNNFKNPYRAEKCVPGCGCKNGYVYQTGLSGECVLPVDCPRYTFYHG